MKKVTYVVSNINRSAHFEWIASSRLREDFDLSFVLLNPGPSLIERMLRERGIPVRVIPYRGKKDLPRAVLKLTSIFRSNRPDVVHAHLMDGSLAGLTAARIAGIARRLHTRHHSNLHYAHYPHALYYDRWVNRLSTRIIATCENVRNVLTQMDRVPADKVSVVHFGFDLAPFETVSVERVTALKAKYRIEGKRPIVGVIARYMEYKGVQFVIPAFKRLLAEYPDACLFLANTSGKEYADEIRRGLGELPPESYREVVFEEDFAALYRLFDVLVHAPIDRVSEAFGQVYVEALAAQVPCVFTLSGVASEFVRDGKNSLVVAHRNSDQIYAAVRKLLQEPELGARLAREGHSEVRRLFPLSSMIEALALLYRGL